MLLYPEVCFGKYLVVGAVVAAGYGTNGNRVGTELEKRKQRYSGYCDTGGLVTGLGEKGLK